MSLPEDQRMYYSADASIWLSFPTKFQVWRLPKKFVKVVL